MHVQNVQSIGNGFIILDGGSNITSQGDDALRFYAGGRSGSCARDGVPPSRTQSCTLNGNASTGAATLRRDSFASLVVNANASAGSLLTRTIQFDSKSRQHFLFVNVALASVGGGMNVALLFCNGSEVPGFRAIDFERSALAPAGTDDTRLGPLRWSSGDGDLTTLASTPFQLRIVLFGSGSSLFSFWVSPSTCGESLGATAGGGPGLGRGAVDTEGRCTRRPMVDDESIPLTPMTTAIAGSFSVDWSTPALVGSSDLTHFWFPAEVLDIATSPDQNDTVTSLQYISRAGDGKSCPPKSDPNLPCNAVLNSRDGGRSYQVAPPSGPFPMLPENPLFPKRATNRFKFRSLNQFECVNATCSGQVVTWTSSRNGTIINATKYEKLHVSGVTSHLLSARSAERPIKLRNGITLLPTYGYADDAEFACGSQRMGLAEDRCYSVFFFSANNTDTDPLSWTYASRIDYTPAMSQGNTIEGPCEPAIVQLPGLDDRVLSVFRVMPFTSHWAALSEDHGQIWGTPFSTGTWAVSPNLLALNSGAVVLTSGRPGIGLWLTSFLGHKGTDAPPSWEFHNVAAAHNKGVAVAALRFPDADVAVSNASSHDSSFIANAANPHGSPDMNQASSTAYTGLLALDSQTLLLSYDRLAHGWHGPPGRLGDSDFVFAMRLTIKASQFKSDDGDSAGAFRGKGLGTPIMGIDAQAFGAVGDAKSDNTAALQAGIDAAQRSGVPGSRGVITEQPQGRQLLLPAGIYRVALGLHVRCFNRLTQIAQPGWCTPAAANPLRLSGEGKHLTAIEAAPGFARDQSVIELWSGRQTDQPTLKQSGPTNGTTFHRLEHLTIQAGLRPGLEYGADFGIMGPAVERTSFHSVRVESAAVAGIYLACKSRVATLQRSDIRPETYLHHSMSWVQMGTIIASKRATSAPTRLV